MADTANREDLKRWLNGKPHGVSVAIAARAALRALPVFMSKLEPGRDQSEQAATVVLTLLRSTVTSWAAIEPTHEVASVAYNAAANASAACDDAVASASDSDAYAYATASGAAVGAAATIWKAASAFDTAAMAATATSATDATGSATTWNAVIADCEAVDAGLGPAGLASRPLWPAGTPDWVTRQWSGLKTALAALDEDWDVWVRWFEARLDGRPVNRDLEVRRVTFLTDEEWGRGPRFVNARIKELEEDYEGDEGAEADEVFLGQVPASHSYAGRNGRIVAVPQHGETLDHAAVSAILPELQEKARDYCEAAENWSNCPQRVLRTATGLKEVLQQWARNPQPGSLLMRLRSLEGDLLSYDTPEGRAELFPDAIGSMADLQASVGDLVSLYPIVQKMQASALALNIQRADVVSIHVHLATIENAAVDSESVDDSARAALSEGRADVEDATQTIETSTDERKVANAIEQRAEKTAFRVLSARNFVSAALKAAQEGTVDGVKDGFKGVLSGGIKTGFAVLVGTLAGPVAGIATFIASWSPFAQRAEEIEKQADSHDHSDKA